MRFRCVEQDEEKFEEQLSDVVLSLLKFHHMF